MAYVQFVYRIYTLLCADMQLRFGCVKDIAKMLLQLVAGKKIDVQKRSKETRRKQ